MKELFLIRHGETDWNAQGRIQGIDDIPLNERGEEQAAQLAEALVDIGIEHVVTSHLSRAARTAEILALRLGTPAPVVIPGLQERDYGPFAGMTAADRQRHFPNGLSMLEHEAVEPLDTVRARVLAAAARILEAPLARRIAVVSHGGALNSLIAHVTDGRLGTGKTLLANCSLTKLRHAAGTLSLEYCNVAAGDLPHHETASYRRHG